LTILLTSFIPSFRPFLDFFDSRIDLFYTSIVTHIYTFGKSPLFAEARPFTFTKILASSALFIRIIALTLDNILNVTRYAFDPNLNFRLKYLFLRTFPSSLYLIP
jgi:hypothetical protein